MRHSARLKAVLEREIVSGEIRSGQRLEEKEIAERFGVSRTPVREALMMLEAVKLVERRPNQGVVVRGVTLRRLVQMLEALTELEALAGRLAARRARPEALAVLTVALENFHAAAATGDADAAYDANIGFHKAIYSAGANDELLRFTEEVGERMEPFLRAQHHRPGWIEKVAAEHDAIHAAIPAGPPDTAHRRLREHVALDSDLLIQASARPPQ